MVRLIRKPQFIDEFGDPIRRLYHYQVYGTIAPSVAVALVEADQGPTIVTPTGVLFRARPDCRQIAYNKFDVDIEYLVRPQGLGDWFWEIDGSGYVENVKTSLEQVAKYPSGAPDSNNIIGFDEGEIHGADVIRPGGKLIITFNHPTGVMTIAYGAYLMGLVDCYNLNPWLQWQAGEVRFLKPRVSDGSDSPAQCVYEFEIRKNESNFAVGPITGISKLGWHVIDVRSKSAVSSGGTDTVATRVLTHAYIHRVSRPIDFASAFGIG